MPEKEKEPKTQKYVVVSPINAHLQPGDPNRHDPGDYIELPAHEAARMSHAVALPADAAAEEKKADILAVAQEKAAKIIAEAEEKAAEIEAKAVEKAAKEQEKHDKEVAESAALAAKQEAAARAAAAKVK